MASLAAAMARKVVTVFGRTSSSNTQKVIWALKESRVPYEVVLASARIGTGSNMLVSRSGGSPFGVVDTGDYIAMNPHRQIPTLVDPSTGAIVWESHSCVRYVACQYHQALIGGREPGAQAQQAMWMDWVLSGNDYSDCFGSANHHLIDQVARTPAAERDMKCLANNHAMYMRLFSRAEDFFVESNTDEPMRFLTGGSSLTVADIPLAVELNRWNLCVVALKRDQQDHALAFTPVPPMPKLSMWYERLLSSETFVEAVVKPEAEHQQLDPATIRGLTFND